MKLSIFQGPESGTELVINEPGTYLIGRSSDCKLRLSDPEASRHHAAITLAPGRAVIDDQSSRNGTRVNDVRVQHAMLQDGDVVRAGGTHFTVTGLNVSTPGPQSTLHAIDPSMRVLASLNHRDADLLAGVKVDATDAARENEMLRAVGEVSHIIVSGEGRAPTLEAVLEHIKSLLAADNACIMLWDAERNDWKMDAGATSKSGGTDTVSVSRTIINEAVKEGVALLTENPLSDDRFGPSESIVIHKISSALCAPMTINDKLNGALCVSRHSRADAFTPLDLRFTATVANILGVYLEKLRIESDYIKQERLAAVGQVIAGLAHYAKNIITGLQLSVAGMQKMLERQSFEQIGSCVNSIAIEEHRLTNLILDMLSYAKDRKPMCMPMQVNDVLNAVVRPFKDDLKQRGITLDLDLATDLPDILAEKNALHRVFLNLFVNAMDALEEREDGEKTIRISTVLREGGSMLEVTVWDSGCGIPAAVQENIFGVFFSTKGSKGTGLGLAVSRKIVEEHHGTIAIHSEADKWTEFRVRLPVETESTRE